MSRHPLRPRYYVIDGHEPRAATLYEWASWFEDDKKRRVARTEISKGVVVSTIFLGLDHAFGDGPPVLFETMVFGGEHNGDQRRYCTWAEAEIGHMELVEELTPAEAET
jgi:hypothetical protein